ncbi:MAG: DNA translocase FtsK 4TM domain-containing protein, partial [Gammaproteobacteria bacterium]|nr:DNA translocase FtsK 4TM domain-containing protein [Gammaproteobacteria bacterium]
MKINNAAQASRGKASGGRRLGDSLARGSREGALIVFSAVALYFALALTSYHPSDPGWSHSGHVDHVLNQGGRVGAWIADVFLYLFGYMAYLFPIMVA